MSLIDIAKLEAVRIYFTTTILIHEGFNTTIETTIEKLNETQKAILKLIEEEPFITITQMAERLNLSREGVRYNVNKLKDNNIIYKEGSTKKGKWIINNKM